MYLRTNTQSVQRGEKYQKGGELKAPRGSDIKLSFEKSRSYPGREVTEQTVLAGICHLNEGTV